MDKRVRITNDSINSYGTRVLTSGMNVEQYNRNPVLLYMHERGKVIGYIKDLRVEGGEVTGELVFDCASELSKQCKKQWEFGSLRMVSAGIDIIELSEDPQYLLPGQTRPTITKSKLYEVSLVDVGANDDAIVLSRNGEHIKLGLNGECSLPELSNNNKNQTNEMETKTIALQLGLPETATEAEITTKLGELKAAKEQHDALLKENESLVEERISGIVDKAIAEKRLTADKKDEFISLGKEMGAEKLSKVIAAMSPRVKLSAVLSHQGGSTKEDKTYNKLSEVPAAELLAMRKENAEEYKRLYKAEYGVECEI